MAKNCKGCKHWRSSSINNADMGFVCHYLLDTGGNKVKIDGVCQQYDSTPYNKNDKYEEGYKKMPRAKIDDHEAAIRLFENGKTVTEVTAITGFAYKTVWRWHRDWKKDNAPIGNVSPEVAERLKEIREKPVFPYRITTATARMMMKTSMLMTVLCHRKILKKGLIWHKKTSL